MRKLQSEYDEKFLNEKSEFEKLYEEIFILQQKLYEKESALVNVKRENEKNSQQDNLKEIFIADPTRINVELNNELNYTRDIMTKVSKMLNHEKSKNEKLEKKNKKLEDDFEELKRISINVPLNNSESNEHIINNNKKESINNESHNNLTNITKLNNNNNGLSNLNNLNSRSSKLTNNNNKSYLNNDANSGLNNSLINKSKNKCKYNLIMMIYFKKLLIKII